MNTKSLGIAVCVAVWCSALACGSGAVDVSTVFAQSPGDQLALGEVLLVPLDVRSGGDVVMFGAELELMTETGDLAIRSVTVDAAFSGRPASASDDERGFKLVGTQPLASINRSLGTGGAAVHFATVELEVLTDRPFESALIVRGRGALVGQIPESTVVVGNPSGDDGWSVARIPIVNLADRAGDQATGDQETLGPEAGPWTVEQAAVALEVRAVGGGEPVTALQPNSEYQLHYHLVPGSLGPSDPAPNGFDLIVTGPAWPPTSVEGSDCWVGAEVVELAPSAEGWPRVAVSADLLADGSQLEAQSLICTFTTDANGQIGFELRLYASDPAARTLVQMTATAELAVE